MHKCILARPDTGGHPRMDRRARRQALPDDRVRARAARASSRSTCSRRSCRAPTPPPLIFVYAICHFEMMYVLDLRARGRRQGGHDIAMYTPEGCATAVDFEKKYGEKLWESDEPGVTYGYQVVKVRTAAPFPSVCLSSAPAFPHPVSLLFPGFLVSFSLSVVSTKGPLHVHKSGPHGARWA